MKRTPVEGGTQLPPKWHKQKAATKAARLVNLQKANAARESKAGLEIVLAQREREHQESIAKAVEVEVDARIDQMCAGDNNLPPLWNDLAWALETFARDTFGTTMNQRLLKQDRIAKIEALCRQIGLGGTYDLKRSATH